MDIQGSDLKAAYWISTNRSKVEKIGYGIGIAIVSIIWLVVLFNIIIYIKDYRISKDAEITLGQTSGVFSGLTRPSEIKIIGQDILESGNESYDAYVVLNNPNTLYLGEFEYVLTIGGDQLTFPVRTIMPNENLYIIAKGVPASSLATSLDISLNNVVWRRIDGRRSQPDFEITDLTLAPTKVLTRTLEETTDKTGLGEVGDSEVSGTGLKEDIESDEEGEFFTPDSEEDAPEELDVPMKSITSSTAKITNIGSIGYRTVYAVLIVRNENDDVIAVHQQVLHDLDTFDELPFTVSWSRQFVFNASPELILYTNYIESENLILPGDE